MKKLAAVVLAYMLIVVAVAWAANIYTLAGSLNVGNAANPHSFVHANGYGVFEDSLRTNGPATMGACVIAFDSMKVAGTVRGNSGLYVGGPIVTKILTGTFTLDVGSITLQSSRFETVTITGLNSAAHWICEVQPDGSDLNSGVGIGEVRVSADNTLKIEFLNDTIGNIDPASMTYSYICFRQ